MIQRLDEDARHRLISQATDEAKRRGDDRIGTEHLLLALLAGTDSATSRELGVDINTARAALDELDRQALAAVGLDLPWVVSSVTVRTCRRPSLSSGARSALVRAVEHARQTKTRRIHSRDLLIGLLGCQRPDPAAELLAEMGVDTEAVRSRLIEQAV